MTGWRGPCAVAFLGLSVLALQGSTVSAVQEEKDEPVATGLVEEAGITLTLIDVEARDEDGRPLRGLSKEDFVVRLDGKKWPVYSVDDLCDCEETLPGSRLLAASDPPREEGEGGEPPETPPEDDPPAPRPSEVGSTRYVLYFDFSQLQMDGRTRAVRAAKRWIRRTLKEGEEVLVAAHSTASGLQELSSFTDDKEKLLALMDEIYEDPAFIDPFPSQFDNRIRDCSECCVSECYADAGGCGWCEVETLECSDCCTICGDNASAEYFHGRRSLKALRRFLVDLQREPGRKALIFFHQNGLLYPARFYQVDEERVGDHLRLLRDVGAEAMLSRTGVYPAYSGEDANLMSPLAGQAVHMGASLADYTGAEHNRGPDDLAGILDNAGRGCACTYRIGLIPPEEPERRVYTARVEVSGHVLEHRYQLRFLSDLDQWLRRAEGVLKRPEDARDLDVDAAIVPLSAEKNGWDVVVQVALDLDSLMLLPSSGKQGGKWEVGALLSREGGGRNWEMLGISSLSVGAEEASSRKAVLHQRIFPKLKPGQYRLGAFVRDQSANVFGGDEALLDLPRPAEGGVVGPVLMRSAREHLQAPLPIWKKKPTGAVRVADVKVGPVPAGRKALRRGDPLSAMSFLCQKGETVNPADILRYVSRDEIPLFRFEEAEPEPAGACLKVLDHLETWRLPAGSYTYHIRWNREDGNDLSADVDFRISGRGKVLEEPAKASASP